mmetsp:Transcript_53331/g.148315  ORF Transcript_53331/g.148315 Transcript_53331/m.148315 type:complete len:202 (-) Transcript_53331:221-826(-)
MESWSHHQTTCQWPHQRCAKGRKMRVQMVDHRRQGFMSTRRPLWRSWQQMSRLGRTPRTIGIRRHGAKTMYFPSSASSQRWRYACTLGRLCRFASQGMNMAVNPCRTRSILLLVSLLNFFPMGGLYQLSSDSPIRQPPAGYKCGPSQLVQKPWAYWVFSMPSVEAPGFGGKYFAPLWAIISLRVGRLQELRTFTLESKSRG